MELYAHTYEVINGKYEKVKTDKVVLWYAVHVETGEVDISETRRDESELYDLVSGWEWRKFTFPLNKDVSEEDLEEPWKHGDMTRERVRIEIEQEKCCPFCGCMYLNKSPNTADDIWTCVSCKQPHKRTT